MGQMPFQTPTSRSTLNFAYSAPNTTSEVEGVSLHCELSLAAQCIVIGPVCLFVCRFVSVCGSVITITRNVACIDLHQTGSVDEGSDHLQLVKFWPSCAAGNGVCGGAKIFGSALQQPARNVCVCLSAFSFSFASFLRRHCHNLALRNNCKYPRIISMKRWDKKSPVKKSQTPR